VNDSPIIALRGLTQLKWDDATDTITVGAGMRWQHVAGECEKHGRMAVTGRMGHVGVPGLLLGGKSKSNRKFPEE
jgi:FAD binding domain-containing protein